MARTWVTIDVTAYDGPVPVFAVAAPESDDLWVYRDERGRWHALVPVRGRRPVGDLAPAAGLPPAGAIVALAFPELVH